MDDHNPTDLDLESVREFFDQRCSAYIPSIDPGAVHPSEYMFSDIPDCNKENDLINLINRVQKHTVCGKHCLRKDKKSGKMICRYNFPKDKCDYSYMEKEDGFYRFVPKRNDGYVQRYNWIITSIWRANTDFSPITSTYAVLR